MAVEEVQASFLKETLGMKDAYNELKESFETLQREYETTRAELASESKPRFDTTYGYDRGGVVELSQVICCSLEDKPSNIDSQRLFICIQRMYRALKQDRHDNPQYYHVNMRMLINICLATSGWFTDRQIDRMDAWCEEQGWQ